MIGAEYVCRGLRGCNRMEVVASVLWWLLNVVQSNWQGLVAATLGTFGGAYSAFYCERKHAEKKERSRDIASLRKTQFVIFGMLNCALCFKKQALDQKRDDEHRYLSMAPHHIFSQAIPIDLESISFMLGGNGAQILNEIMRAEEIYNTFIAVNAERCICHQSLQEIVANPSGRKVGKDLDAKIRTLTDSVYEMNADTIAKTKSVFDAIGAYIKENYPKEKALKFELHEEYKEG